MKWCTYTEASQKSAHSDERPIQEKLDSIEEQGIISKFDG